jgi:hypothetical protein
MALTRLNSPRPRRLRRHPPQQRTCLRVTPQQQPGRQTCNDQQRDSTPSAQPRPRRDLLAPHVSKAQPPLHIAKARLTPRAACLFCQGLLRLIGPIGHHIPLALGIPLATHGHPQRLRGPLTAPQASQRPARVLPGKRNTSRFRHTPARQLLVRFWTRITNATPMRSTVRATAHHGSCERRTTPPHALRWGG